MVGTVETLIIGEQRSQASDGATIDVYDPSSGEVLATIPSATKADVDRAVQTAREAFESRSWRDMKPADRGRILFKIAQAVRERAEELATLESRDNGKPMTQARADVQKGSHALANRIRRGSVAVYPLGSAVFFEAIVDVGDDPNDQVPPPGYRRIFTSRYYAVYANCP